MSSDVYHGRKCFRAVAENPNAAISWFLMASYAYYVESDPILSDHDYDALARFIVARWDAMVHVHKHLLDRGSLASTSSFELSPERYPLRVVSALRTLRKDYPPDSTNEEYALSTLSIVGV